MAFSMLVLFCLAQNSGVFRALEQLNESASTYSSSHAVEVAGEAGNSQAQDAEFKQCELSEKSLRVCLDEPPVLPLLVLLFIFPLIPFASSVLQRALNVPVLPRPRRIHLSLCRFQE